MTTPDPSRRLARGAVAVALVLAGLLIAVPARAQEAVSARQVTIFGIIATPDDAMIDPKLASISSQLRKLLPNHGFRLLDVQTKRLAVGQTVGCSLGGGFVASTTLVDPLDENGKVGLRCALLLNMAPQLETLVTTPPNQLFFCDKQLDDGSRLLIGVGAR